jgi:iron complex outermembrane recepter protein
MQTLNQARKKRRIALLSLLFVTTTPVPVFAQDPVIPNPQTSEETEKKSDIVVLGDRIKGGVETTIKPIEEIGETDIAALGASSLAEVLAAVAPQAGSGRGRGGGGMPIILLNGQRISGFRELRDLPPEAIKRVQIFPEELALKYGFRPDQRVINFILKDNFASFNAEIEHAIPDQGGFSSTEWSNGFTRIGATERININAQFAHDDRLLESRRDIISASAALPFRLANGSNDVSAYRSLLPATEQFELNTSYSKAFGPQTIGSVNVTLRHNDASSLLGLPTASILVPATSPFARSASNVTLNRYFTQPRALTRKSETDTLQIGSTFNTLLGEWRLAMTGDYSNVKNGTRTDRNNDFTALQAGVTAGTIDPYASNFGDGLSLGQRDLTESLTTNLNLRGTLSGKLFELPAGPIQATVRTGFNRQTLRSEVFRQAVTTSANLDRNDINAAISIDVPLLARGPLGDLSINGNFGQSDLSDFGRLTEYGAGLQWKPVKELSLSASIFGDENAPGIGSLSNPLLITPNVATYDFQRGRTVFIDQISGGNPNLVGERRRDFKMGLNWSPKKIEGLSLQIEYFRNNSTNTTASFPLLTAEIEAAFPGRVVRDGNGQIRTIDQRPINYARERSQRIRFGFSYSGSIGPQPRGFGGGFGGGGFGGGPRGAAPGPQPRPVTTPATPPAQPTAPAPASKPATAPATAKPARPGSGGFNPSMLPNGGRPPSRWQISLYDTWTLSDDALIRDGVPLLDRLNGSAVDQNGATPVHAIELAGGAFLKGVGVRLSGNYRTATRVTGNAALGNGDLRFGDLLTLNANFFMDLDSQGNLTKKIRFLKGGRLAFRIENVFGDIIDVRDGNGNVPISYQPGYLDPKGRVFELSFRKRF